MSTSDIQQLLAMENRGVHWVVPGRVLQGAYPYGFIRNLVQDYKITRILNLTEFGDSCYEPVLKELFGKEAIPEMLTYFYIPDYGTPSKNELDTIIKDLLKQFADGHNIYIHCHAGKGRSTIVATCMLGKLYKLDGENALKLVRRAYARKRGTSPIPDTDAQEELIRRYLG